MTKDRSEQYLSRRSWPDELKLTFRVLLQAVKDFRRDSGPQWAAAVAFYSLLSFFPLVLSAVSIAAFFVDGSWAVDQLVHLLGAYLPQGEQRISDTVKGVFEARGPASIVSFVLLLWSGSRVFGVLVAALNKAFDVAEPYSFLKRRIAELLMTLTIGLLFVIAMVSRFIIQYLRSQTILLPDELGFLFSWLQALVPAILLFIVFFLIYRFVPKANINTRAAFIGAVGALMLFLIARLLFLGYIRNIASYNLIYGSLAIVVILMIWAWMIAIIVLLGGEVTSKVQKMVIDRSKEE